jgi:ADP-ribosylation factor-like protein 5B
MGVLFSKVWQAFFSYDEFKVIIVGLNNAGKTTTLYKLYGQPPSPSPTTAATTGPLIFFFLIYLFVCSVGGGPKASE